MIPASRDGGPVQAEVVKAATLPGGWQQSAGVSFDAVRRGCAALSAWTAGLVGMLSHLGVTLLLGLIRLYQKVISPGLRPCCRFVPSCSTYAVESLKKHGLLRGFVRSLWRLCRCHPFGKGGLDLP